METKEIYNFGPFRADGLRRTLTRNGDVVPLPGKAFDVLYALLRDPGQTVLKEDLMKEVWPDTFVEEGNLTQMVFLLRKALGDTEGGQPLIVTVPRQGYRFTGGVTDAANGELSAATAIAQPGSAAVPLKAGLGKSWRIGAAIALLSGFGGWMLAHFSVHEPVDGNSVIRYTILPVENTSFRSGKISPDGRSLALVGMDTLGKERLWVRRLDAVASHPLTTAEFWPFWSPDSRFIAFAQDGKLKKIEASGGTPQTICDAALVIGGTWNRQGIILFSNGEVIYRVTVSGGDPRPLTRLDSARGETSHGFPVFLPDGQHFLYTVHSGKSNIGGIYVGSLDDPDRRVRLLNDVSNADYAPGLTPKTGYLLFVRSGVLMGQSFGAGDLQLRGEAFPVMQPIAQSAVNLSASFSTSENGVLLVTPAYPGDLLTWFDRTGNRLGTIGRPGIHFSPQLAPDEQTIAVEETDPERFLPDIWLLPVGTGAASRLTFDGSLHAIWSPEGGRVAFEALNTALYSKTATGTENETLLLEATNLPDDNRLPCEWSEDGKFLIYSQRGLRTGYDLWMVPVAGNRKPAAFLHAEYNEWCGTLSPDGKWIAYAADRSGRPEIYVQAFSGEGDASERKSQISDNGDPGRNGGAMARNCCTSMPTEGSPG